MLPAIVIHGGAWAIPDNLAEASVLAVKEAAQRGYEILQGGGSALDAVEAAVILLEDNPAFDAGTGAVLNEDGEVELDAMIMEGKSLAAGGVCCVKNIKNPVQLARLVMENTDHVLLSGQGANTFAKSQGIEEVPVEILVTEESKREWETYMQFRKTVKVLFRERQSDHDTVGAVAVDSNGNVACATSTGGITAKMAGRVGDSPLIGSGGYCDNDVGAVSCTGHGESILKVCLARHIIQLMADGHTAQQGVEAALTSMSRKVQGTGGAVVVSNKGELGMHFNTERMAWAAMRNGDLKWGLNPGEEGIGVLDSSQKLSVPPTPAAVQSDVTPCIVVHGGAGSGFIPSGSQKYEAYTEGVLAASKAGYQVLKDGGSAVDAVVVAVKVMEDNPSFNAGTGSKLTVAGTVEMDALVCDGQTLNSGAVATVKNIKNAIELAKLVMDKTDHMLIVDKGANVFASKMNIQEVDPLYLVTGRSLDSLKTYTSSYTKATVGGYEKRALHETLPSSSAEHETVGAVAVDYLGNVASATSTGGITAKMCGRVGDVPIVGNSAQQASEKALHQLAKRIEEAAGAAGLITVTPGGDIGVYTITGGMSWAAIKNNEPCYGINHGDYLKTTL
ncbi:isoaspartyl peptidase/L-asparaginase isoform X2 [Lingula anatina]|uniref:Isoaspartyl peptidase/L-asparaginase isoform X2 n=1 Tax=Lingula anatina TaxID=7574 RepID=A0A1S3HEC7_LINAN|nr:isoaspartyl peptidase/L-asparaginase isoform X2 [Lingula anatina]|eukprot:XP_013384408.1 isoaspartyl peptidase/L-asparaginase isoform X2 [Lingula anatina]